jgi:Fe-Mn family superoxide dismutase
MQRREFLAVSLAAGVGGLQASQLMAGEPSSVTHKGDRAMPFQQPPLPYAKDALKPFASEEQMTFHYDKHHAAYFKNLNALVEGKPEAEMPLRELVIQSTGPVFNNAAQAMNHSFFWDCLSPDGGREPTGALAAAILRDLGGMANFRKAFSEAAAKLFGSGWAWLAADSTGKLEIMSLGNADTPLKHQREPILTIDVWEHAYYIDYRNERPRYIEAFWSKVNWDFAQKCYAEVK